MTWSREEGVRVKQVRQGIVEARPVGTRKRQAKPVIVEVRWPGCGIEDWREWHRWNSYATREIAETAMANARRKSGRMEYRIKE